MNLQYNILTPEYTSYMSITTVDELIWVFITLIKKLIKLAVPSAYGTYMENIF